MTADPGTPPPLDALPEAVRSRLVAVAAEVLPDVPGLPARLRTVAEFAANRRARVGAGTILDALADDGLRERIAAQVAARRTPEDVADPAEAAGLAWLMRADGWEDLVAAAVPAGVPPGAAAPRADEAGSRADRAPRELREEHRRQLEELRADNSVLRRRLGEARRAERAARERAETAEAALAATRDRAEATAAAHEIDVRRLRAALERLEVDQRDGRRAARTEREEASARARLLLDALIDAAAGLRRELALPPVSTTPGERVADALEPPAADVAGPSRLLDTPAALDQQLALPRARLIVDGYNVTKTAWPTTSLADQRSRLLAGVGGLVARTRAETTVVFDAAEADVRPAASGPRGVRVVFSPRGVIADEVIGQLVEAEPVGRVVVVVSDDGEVRARAGRAGARSAPGAALLGLLARG